MTGTEYKALSLEEQVSYVNSQLSQGMSLNKIFEDLGLVRVSETRIIQRSGYVYDKIQRVYYKSDTPVTENEHKSITTVTDDEHKSNTKVVQKKHKSDTKVFESFPEGIDWVILAEMIEKYKNGELVSDSIAGVLVINPEDFKGKICSKTMKLYTGVLADFQDFANEYSQYSFQDLHNMALVEFMKRYGKRG